MASRRVTNDSEEPSPSARRRVRSPEAREKQLISKAWDELERRIDNHTATSQELVTLLKLGTQREQLEMERLRGAVEYERAKTEAIAKTDDFAQIAQNAIDAMKSYSGVDMREEDPDAGY